jgi:hypothetical protein
MLTISQQIRAGMALNSLYRRHASVRWYLSLLLRLAPRKYKRLLEAKRKAPVFLFALVALLAISRLN